MCGGGSAVLQQNGNIAGTIASGSAGGGQSHSHTLSANFVGSSQSTLPPYLVLVYIIKI